MSEKSAKRPDLSNPQNSPSAVPYIQAKTKFGNDKDIPDIYAPIDNDLARDNLENHLTAADRQDL